MTQNSTMPIEAIPRTMSEARVLLAGLGNIGSFVAGLLAPLVGMIRLIDRDVVEIHNTINQWYGPEHVGRPKVEAIANHLKALAPSLVVEGRVADLESSPWGDFSDVDIVFAGLDSLRARQSISEKVSLLQVPYVDGAVGDPLLVRVQVLAPGGACLECGFGAEHYRQITTEYPCQPGAAINAPRTSAPACAGAVVAGLMVAQGIRRFSGESPQDSYEINGDLVVGRFVTTRRRRNHRCRYSHSDAPQQAHLQVPFADATVAHLLDAVKEILRELPETSDSFDAASACRLEFPRGVLRDGLFGPTVLATLEELEVASHQRLDEFGLTLRDRVVVHAGQASVVHVCLDTPCRSC